MGKKHKLFALLFLVTSLCLAACGGERGGGGSSGGGSSSGGEGGGSQPFTPAHAGTKADPYSVSDAYGLIEEMEDNEYGTATVYVTGTITSDASDIYYNSKYNSATFMMSDGTNSIKAYSISGCSVTDGDDNFVGKDYEVVVGGVLIKYLENGNVVPEVGYSSSAKNTTELVSSIPPGGPKETFTITFNSNGGSSVASIKVKEGSLPKKPGDPTKEGYDFAGWYKDADLTEPFDWNAPVTENITLYAKWTENDSHKAAQAFEKLDNLSNLSVNIQSATSLGLAKTAAAPAKAHKKLDDGPEGEEEFEPSNTLVMTSTDYQAGDPEANEDGTVDVSFTKIDTTVKTEEVKGDTTLIASAKDGDTGEVVIKDYSGSTITFESDTKHEYRIIDKDGKVVQNWFKGQANETTTDPIEGTYVNYTYEPVHAGTLQDPYSVTDAFELISELAENGHDNETVYVKGTVTSYSDEISSTYNEKYNSASYTISDGVHSIRAYSISGYSLNPSDGNYIDHGYEVVVAGVLIKYMNNGSAIPEVGYNNEAKNKTQLISSTAPTGGGNTFNPIHEGTLEDPYSVTDAFGLIDIMMAGDFSTETVYVKGTISSPTNEITINDTYHSGTFMITDGNSSIKAYSINGCSKDPNDEGFIDTGYEVVVAGVFIKYNDNGTIVPEIGYSSSVSNTTALVSKTAPAPSEPVDLSDNTVDSKTKEYTVEARSIDSIVSYPNYEGFKYTLTDENDNVIVAETTAEGAANISTDDSLIVFDGLIEGKQYTLHYEGLGEETTVEQSTVGGEIDKMYVYNEQFTFVSFVPYGTGSRPEGDKMIYESDGIANYDRRDYYSAEDRLSFIFDNYSGFIYLIENFHIKYIHNNLLLSDNDDFVYDFKIDEDNNLVIYALFTSTSINAFNFFKDKNGVNCIETDKLNTYDEETDTYYFVAEPNRDDLTKIQTCGEFKTHDELRAYVDKHLDRIDLQNILSNIGQYSMGDFRDDKNQRYYLTTTGETLYLEYRSDIWKSMLEFYMVLPNGEKRELNIGDKFTGVTHYGWWGELVRVSQGVIYGLRNSDSYSPYLACQGEIWFYDFALNEDIYYTSLPGFQGGTTTFINWNYIDQYDTLLVYVGETSTLYSWTLGNLDDFTTEPRYMWINNDLSIWVNYFSMTELSDVVLTNCSLSDEFDTLLTHGVHGDISYEVVVEEGEDGNVEVKAYKADEYVAPEIKIVLQPINR